MRYLFSSNLVALLFFCAGLSSAQPQTLADIGPPRVSWADSIFSRLTLEQKVGQLFTTHAQGVFLSVDDPEFVRLRDLVERFEVGGVAFFQADPLGQAVLTNQLQQRSRIPLLISQDMEWGPAMRISKSTEFPYSMAVGATRDPELAYAMGRITADEARALGIHQVYAPVADVNNNPNNPVINVRSFGETPELVSKMVVSFIEGLQDGGVIATAKHFPGHGDVDVDSHDKLPVVRHDLARLDSLELVPFRAAITAGVNSIMTGHLSYPLIDTHNSISAALSPILTSELLRGRLGFDGLIVTDALNMDAVTKQFGPGEAAIRAINAGADIILLSADEFAARSQVIRAIQEGTLPQARIDESVLRILRAKEKLRLNRSKGAIPLDNISGVVGNEIHRVASETIARKSLTLLKNDNQLLPVDITSTAKVVTLSPARMEGIAEFEKCLTDFLPGISVTNLDDNTNSKLVQSTLQGAAEAPEVIVAMFIGRGFNSDKGFFSKRQLDFVEALARRGKDFSIVLFGSPFAINELPASVSSILLAYGAGSASQRAAAEAVAGRVSTDGLLPISVSPDFPYGAGLRMGQAHPRQGLPGEAGMDARVLARIDSLMHASMENKAFPGASVAVGRPGVTTVSKQYGFATYDSEDRITKKSLYDLASLTKVVATTTAVMKLYDQGKLPLDAKVASFIPEFAVNGKEGITIKHLLTHTSGLPAYRRYYSMEDVKTSEDVIRRILSDSLVTEPGARAKYSDLGIISLGLVVEKITGKTLAEYAKEAIFEPLGMHSTGFRSQLHLDDSEFVPTEVDANYRMRLIRGVVHDETAFMLGGVAGHAGLFSTLDDLTTFAHMLIADGRVGRKQFLKPETIRLFTSLVKGTERGLGWDIRSKEGYSSAGTLFGPRSYGHTGFTGTSMWIDPDAEVFVILLTNRVHPTRANQKIRNVRAELADIVFKSLVSRPIPLLPHRETAH